MRIALLSLLDPDPAPDFGARAEIRHCGRPLAAHQLALAIAAGADTVIGLVDDAAFSLAERLKQPAVDVGVRFECVRTPRALRAKITAADELLVLSAGVLPEPQAFGQLAKRPHVAAFPADNAVQSGFERIDSLTAWAGVLLVPGAIAEKLADFDEDIDIVATLLRLGLQAGVPVQHLDPALLSQGAWLTGDNPAALAEREQRWFAAKAAQADFRAPAVAFAELSGLRLACDLGGTRYQTLPTVLAIMALASALLAGALGWLPAAFILAAAGFVLARIGHVLDTVLALPQVEGARRRSPALEIGGDLVLGLVLVMASPERYDWLRLFVPLTLFAALYLAQARGLRGWRIVLSDRALLALVLAVFEVFGLAFSIAAILALAILASLLFERRAEIMAD